MHFDPDPAGSGHTRRDADYLRSLGLDPATAVAPRERGTVCGLCPLVPGRVRDDVWHRDGHCDRHWTPPQVTRLAVAS